MLAGRSFDVLDNCGLAMSFVPATATAHGRVTCGRDTWTSADGMNDRGLFVAVADVPTLDKVVSFKPPADLTTFLDGLLANCATVKDALAWCQQQPAPRLGGWLNRWSIGNSKHPFLERYTYNTPQHVLIADSTGDSVVCEWIRGRFKAVRKTGRYELMTNFLLSAPQLGNYPCPRFATDSKILDESEKPSLETCVALLKATASGGTKYSLVCDLPRGEIHIYLRCQFEQPRACT
ncbi:MAG: hypothetical protein JWQ71_3821 [Pedosphaera sp.]|nr:hypothetical protein [Pedosphaera sp.]